MEKESIKRGSIVLCALPETGTCVQGKTRPAVVISNDRANKVAPVISIVPLTRTKKALPVHTIIESTIQRSTVLAEQLTTIDKKQIIKELGMVSDDELMSIVKAIKIQLAIQ